MGFAAAAAVPVSLGRAADIDRILQAADDVEEGHDPNVARIRKPPASPFLSPSLSPLQGGFCSHRFGELGGFGPSGSPMLRRFPLHQCWQFVAWC